MHIKKVMVKKEGVVILLSERGKLKTGNVQGTEFIVSWDKIGELLFDNYNAVEAVMERGMEANYDVPMRHEGAYCDWCGANGPFPVSKVTKQEGTFYFCSQECLTKHNLEFGE